MNAAYRAMVAGEMFVECQPPEEKREMPGQVAQSAVLWAVGEPLPTVPGNVSHDSVQRQNTEASGPRPAPRAAHCYTDRVHLKKAA